MERHCFLGSIVDGATRSGAEAGMGSGMFQWEIVELEELELIYGESEDLGHILRSKELGRCVRRRDEGHVCRRLMWCTSLYLVSSCLACLRLDSGSQVFSNDG